MSTSKGREIKITTIWNTDFGEASEWRYTPFILTANGSGRYEASRHTQLCARSTLLSYTPESLCAPPKITLDSPRVGLADWLRRFVASPIGVHATHFHTYIGVKKVYFGTNNPSYIRFIRFSRVCSCKKGVMVIYTLPTPLLHPAASKITS